MDEITITAAQAKVTAAPSQPPPQAMTEAQTKSKAVDADLRIDLNSAVEQLKDFAAENHIDLNFSIHEGTGRTVIKVIETESHRVVREIPPEEVLDLVANIEEMAGHLLSATA